MEEFNLHVQYEEDDADSWTAFTGVETLRKRPSSLETPVDEDASRSIAVAEALLHSFHCCPERI